MRQLLDLAEGRRATEAPERSSFKSLGVFGTVSECRAAGFGWGVQASVESGTLTLLHACLPDGVDPSLPSGVEVRAAVRARFPDTVALRGHKGTN